MDKIQQVITWGHGWYVFCQVILLMFVAAIVLILISKALFGISSRHDKKNKQKKKITAKDLDQMIEAAGF